jgi:hypothetical protein
MRVLLFTMALAVGAGLTGQPVSAAAQGPEKAEQGWTWLAGVHVSVEADMWKGPKLRDVIPLFVTIENKSRDALALRYQEFRLAPSWVQPRMAVPPSQINGAEAVGTLHEGILEPGTRIQGFLFFESGEDPPHDMAVFEMDVVQAATGRTIGTARFRLEID